MNWILVYSCLKTCHQVVNNVTPEFDSNINFRKSNITGHRVLYDFELCMIIVGRLSEIKSSRKRETYKNIHCFSRNGNFHNLVEGEGGGEAAEKNSEYFRKIGDWPT